jgi:Anti-sigma-28 factor, FlgM
MKHSFRPNPESYPNEAERVAAIKKALQEGSYETDSTKVANILIIHLLNHSTRFYRSYVKGHHTLNKLFAVH